MKIPSSVAVTLVCTALSAGSAAAQLRPAGIGAERSDTRGLTLGINFNGGALSSAIAESAPKLGSGLGLTVGYGVSDAVTLFARGTMAYQMSQADVGARYSFGGPAATLRPYVEGALTRTGTVQADLRAYGSALTGGAGVEYFLSRNLALDVGMTYTRGRLTGGRRDGEPVDVSEGFASRRLNVGVRWRP